MLFVLKSQDIPYDHADSTFMFQPSPEKPFTATPAAIEAYKQNVVDWCLRVLQHKAKKYDGLEFMQVFQSLNMDKEDLWIIDDGPGGAITAMLPSDY